ncbi:glycosyltransferase [Leucobacter komagatae]|uniref:Glycosyl transferase n=1 Tax=Leucobacter komagatae TaxID=55969 RepID=A0A0D0HY84_9MICO|nr:nucleotide disphospho-sugar-binding domain-containing protein [Leucobacter komagatae]KIP52516.1 glycosyl transferase [Leucobacter komagatae]
MSAVLLCSTPVYGHVTPLLAVARHLSENGHRVRFLSGAKYRDAIEATGAEFLQLPADADYDDSDMDAAFPERVGLKGPAGIRYDISAIFLRPALSQLAAVEAALSAEPTDAVLVEPMFMGTLGLIRVEREARPAVISLGIIPLGLSSPDTAPYGLGIAPMRGPVGRLRNSMLRFLAQNVIFGGVQKEAEQLILEATGEPLQGFFMNGQESADAIVQFSVPGFEYPRANLPSHVRFVGPLSRTVPSSGELPEWWGELDGSKPMVHVSQGTVANRDYSQLIAPAIAGLAGEDVLVVVSTGGRPVETLPSPLPANVRVASYLPHDKLLPLTDVFVSNGGYGGVHYALEHGVPLVVAGKTEDKAEVTARVGWSGAGVNLATNAPKPEQVRRAVRRVLANDRFRAASARIGAEIAASSGLRGLEEVVVHFSAIGAASSPEVRSG